MTFKPTGTEAKVCDLIAKRQQLGIAKYGTTVAQNPLPLRQWLVHQQEELADALVYCTRAIEELDASGVAAKKYDATNCLGATVFDVDGDVFLKCVKSIDILAREVELFYEPYRVHNPTYTIKFSRIESVFGDAEAPMRFNCYARSGSGGQGAQASSGAGPSGAAVAQASSGAGPSGAAVASGPCLNDLVDRSKGAVSAMRSIVDLIDSGNRQVVSIKVSTALGDAVANTNGLVFSEKVSIELELCK